MSAEAKPVRVGTRKSNLAMWQAKMVHAALTNAHPDEKFEIVGLSTLGDDNQIKPLAEFAAKGVFTKELDVALLQGNIDLAVHCLKDLPTETLEGMTISAIIERGDRQDAVVLHQKHKDAGLTLETLPAGSIIGTSALRRQAMLAKHCPTLVCKNIRGNLNTRLAKLDTGDYDALLLASTGLKRLGFADRIHQELDPETYGYAVGQGALAVMTRAGDERTAKLVSLLEHAPTRLACAAERGMLRTLEGGCKVPIAVRTTTEAGSSPTKRKMTLFGTVSTLDGKTVVSGEETTEVDLESEQSGWALGVKLGEDLLAKGALDILKTIRPESIASASLAAPKKE